MFIFFLQRMLFTIRFVNKQRQRSIPDGGKVMEHPVSEGLNNIPARGFNHLQLSLRYDPPPPLVHGRRLSRRREGTSCFTTVQMNLEEVAYTFWQVPASITTRLSDVGLAFPALGSRLFVALVMYEAQESLGLAVRVPTQVLVSGVQSLPHPFLCTSV